MRVSAKIRVINLGGTVSICRQRSWKRWKKWTKNTPKKSLTSKMKTRWTKSSSRLSRAIRKTRRSNFFDYHNLTRQQRSFNVSTIQVATSLPSLFTTWLHGMSRIRRLRPQTVPTARTADGLPVCSARVLYEMISPGGIDSRTLQTFFWKSVPGWSRGICAKSSKSPR